MNNKTRDLKDVNRYFDTLLVVQKKEASEPPHVSVDNYVDYKEIWAESRFLTGKNFFDARALNIKTTVEFIVRFREDLDETMRLINKRNNKIYNIEGILPLDNERLYLTLKCYEIKHDEMG